MPSFMVITGDKGCLVKVKAYIEDDLLTIYVIDKGQGIQDIEKARQPMFTSKKELEHAGMGLSIIEALCDEMTIESSLELGTQLIMKKRIDHDKEAVLNNIQLAQQGDETAKELIVKNNLGLVWSIVHRFKNNYYDKEDLFQIGCIGLMKAINNFVFIMVFNFQRMRCLLLWEKSNAILGMMGQSRFLVHLRN